MTMIRGKGIHYISKSPHKDSSMWGCERHRESDRVESRFNLILSWVKAKAEWNGKMNGIQCKDPSKIDGKPVCAHLCVLTDMCVWGLV